MNAGYRKIENAGPAGLLSQRFYTPGDLTVTFLPLSSVKSELEQHTLVQLPWAGEDISMTVYAMYDVHSMALPAIESLITFVQSMIVESQA